MPYAPEYLHLVIPGVTFEAWLYGRNSDDHVKDGHSVEDQLSTGRTFCRDFKWRIIDEFKDVGLSASRHGTRARDDFEDLLDAIVHTAAPPGVRRIVVAFEASRYYRDLDAYVRLRRACLDANVLLCYNGQVYDLSRRDDRKTTAMHAIDAEDESEGIYLRNLRTTRLQAEAGAPHGKLPYGYVREYATVNGRRRCSGQFEHPVHGPFVLGAFERIDAGTSLKSVVRWLQSEEDAARPDGAEWSQNLVRALLLNRTYVGERIHRGTVRKAAWAPIKGLDTPQGRAMFNRVVAMLTDPDRTKHRGSEVAHLLTLIALCGQCGDHAKLIARFSTRRKSPTLHCQVAQDTSINETVMDAFVEEAVISWFADKEDARAALLPEGGAVEEKVNTCQRLINGYEEQLEEAQTLAETFDADTGRPRLSATSLASLQSRLEPKLETERKKLRNLTGVSPLLLSMLHEDPDVVWNGCEATDTAPARAPLTLEQRREVIRSVVTVRLHPARKIGVRKLEPGRITLAFLGQPGFRDRPIRARGSAHVKPAAPPAPGSGRGI
ncbi:recombinase family protein [Streptomyces sp. LN704]|uniref:recombinase family protein n=1 Tax=Streptomyces sp. LN704 TaxID=3112982 RepID=UPI00371E772E